MNSFLLIDKAAGLSSFGVIRQLRKITGIKKIGHAGTLDPFATGLLICATGQYTRLLKYAEAQHKSYEATLLFGKKSSTGDPEGEIIATDTPTITETDLTGLRERVLSISELIVPQYSAIKIDGKRAYNLAREGKELRMPSRPVRIYDFEILDMPGENQLRYRVQVSKGTYIRALSEYIAESLGSVGMTIALRRTAIGEIGVEDAISLSESGDTDLQKAVCLVSKVLKLTSLKLEPEQLTAVRHGRAFAESELPEESGELALYDDNGELAGIGIRQGSQVLPTMVFESGKAR